MKSRTTAILVLAVVAAAGILVALLSGAPAAAATADKAAAAAGPASHAGAAAHLITVYKSPTCTCCREWAAHLEENGFRVDVKVPADLMEVKTRNGVPMDLASCHTAEVDGYVLEGHVPAELVHQLLTERPQIRGLAVPGMPAGVPGMPEAGPDRRPYQIFAIGHDGAPELYATR